MKKESEEEIIIGNSDVAIEKGLFKIYKLGLDAESKKKYKEAVEYYQSGVDVMQFRHHGNDEERCKYNDGLHRAKALVIVDTIAPLGPLDLKVSWVS